MSQALADRHCRPCRGGVPTLTPLELERYLAALPGWTLSSDGRRIGRRVTLKTYAEALGLVIRVSTLAEAEGHHPDVAFGWGYADFSLTTHAIGGLHDNDMVLAAKIDRLLASG